MEKIKVEVKKTERLDGQIWYHVWANSDCIEAFMVTADDPDKAFREATNCFNRIVERVKQGFPKVETVSYFDSALLIESPAARIRLHD